MSQAGVRLSLVAARASADWRPAAWTGIGAWGRWTPLVVVLLAAMATRHVVIANTDVSWLITVAEKMLDGARLYVDVLETNPPASILLYVPPVGLARAIGLPPEPVVDGAVFLAAGMAIWIAGRILARAGLLEGVAPQPLVAAVAAIVTILPAQTFGEREHIAVIALLPALAVFAVRAQGLSPTVLASLWAGAGAGIAMVIKPHFIVAVALAGAVTALRARSWRPLLATEQWVAGAIVLVYGAVVALAYPEFITQALPMVRATYVPVRLPVSALVIDLPAFLLLALTVGVVALVRPRALLASMLMPLLAASLGFAVAFVMQGKGWPYHSYPMLAPALIVLAVAGTQRREAIAGNGTATRHRVEQVALLLAAVVLGGGTFRWMNLTVNLRTEPTAPGGLVETIQRIKANPTMLAVAFDIAVGHPLVRQVGGTWVARSPCLWAARGATTLQKRGNLDAQTMDVLNGYAALDRANLVDDIRRARPDIIIVDDRTASWVASTELDPTLPRLLERYRQTTRIDDLLILSSPVDRE